MRKVIGLILLLMVLSSSSFAARPPKVETLPDGYLIIGQYMIYRTQLTQENFDGAQLTTSEVQKMYYKSEFADGQWFNIDESQELVEILMSGGGQTVDSSYLNNFVYSVQIDEDGNIIYFTEGENAMPITDVIGALEAEQAKLENQLDDLTGGDGDAIAEEASDVQIKISALKKSIGIDNSAAEEKQMLEELLAVAMETGNKDLIEALQDDLLKLNPKLSNSEVLVGKLSDLLKEKEALLEAIDQAKRNGFEDLAAALAQELASKDELIDDALKNAQVANNANPSAAIEAVLSEAIAKANALLVAGEEPLPEGLAEALEKYIAILSDVLDKGFKKAILLAATTGGDGSSLDGDGSSLDGDGLADEGQTVGQLFADLLNAKSIDIQPSIIAQLLQSFAKDDLGSLDPLLTEEVLINNQNFGFGELDTILALVDEEVFELIKELVVLKRDLIAFLTTSDLNEDANNLLALLDQLGLGLENEATSLEDKLSLDEEVALLQALTDMNTNTKTLTDLLKAASLIEQSLASGQNQSDTLLVTIEEMIAVAEEMNNLGLVKDLESLRDHLLGLNASVYRNYYQDYMTYKKNRYFLLKDYSGDKLKAHDTAYASYTEAISAYDKGIYFIESNELIDFTEADLEFNAWRLNFEGSQLEQEAAQVAYQAYINNRVDLLETSLAVLSRQLEELYVRLGQVLVDPTNTQATINEVDTLRKGIEQLVIQLLTTLN